MMRILLDTNIIIHRETSKVVNKDIGLLFNWLDKLDYKKYIHPLSIEEISNHKDANVVETMKIKLESYNTLRTESPVTGPIKDIYSNDKDENDRNDTDLLKELYNDRVDFLITEDRGIHRKAKSLKIDEKVFTIDSFIVKVTTENPSLKDYHVLSVKKEYFGDIDLSDAFFNSFKKDYVEFGKWFNSKEDQEAYICKVDGLVQAFLYLKIEGKDEKYNEISPPFESKKRLKIGTFKVKSTGYKLGERFLKIIFDYATASKVDEIYVTIFKERQPQQYLIDLLKEWGFKYWGKKTTHADGKEYVYVRDFIPKVNPSELRKTYPFISKSQKQYIVPIYPEYHTDLFPDSILNNESPSDFSESKPHRNAIQKVYVSRSRFRRLKAGDAIIFYRTGGWHKGVISTLGVVESVIHDIRDENHFIQLCRKRSVFSDQELIEQWNYKSKPFIVNFLYIDSFPVPKVTLGDLQEAGLISEAPRGFVPLGIDVFMKMIKKARANENYIVD